MKSKELMRMRKKIDLIDESLMSLLNKRASIAKAIGKIKLKESLPIQNKEREEEILSKAERFDNSNFISSVFTKIIKESRKIQEEKWKSQ